MIFRKIYKIKTCVIKFFYFFDVSDGNFLLLIFLIAHSSTDFIKYLCLKNDEHKHFFTITVSLWEPRNFCLKHFFVQQINYLFQAIVL